MKITNGTEFLGDITCRDLSKSSDKRRKYEQINTPTYATLSINMHVPATVPVKGYWKINVQLFKGASI
jgi:hypothetical protein